jgi:type I restriction enzyme S subunit
MSSEARITTLGDIADERPHAFVDGPFGSNLPASCYSADGVPVVRGSNLSLGKARFRDDEFVYVPDEVADRLQRSTCKALDIIFTKKGTLGQTGIIPARTKHKRYLLSGNQRKLTVNCAKADPLFVYYSVSSPASRTKIIRDSTVTGVPKTNLAYLKTFPIWLPSLVEQKAIAEVLSALDDRIELNRRMNATLEAMAQALFQSWFVDFDPVRAKLDGRRPTGLDPATAALFPNEFQDSELGPIPKSWEVSTLAEKIELLSGGTPQTSKREYWGGDIPWYSVKDAPADSDVWVIDTEKRVTQLGMDNSAAEVLPECTTIISARGTVGKLALTGVPMAMNQSCYGVRGKANDSDFFTYFLLREVVVQFQQHTHGTVFDTITRQTFESVEFPFPPSQLTTAFDSAVTPLLEELRLNLRESNALAATRETLLPKLLSGEITVCKK